MATRKYLVGDIVAWTSQRSVGQSTILIEVLTLDHMQDASACGGEVLLGNDKVSHHSFTHGPDAPLRLSPSARITLLCQPQVCDSKESHGEEAKLVTHG